MDLRKEADELLQMINHGLVNVEMYLQKAGESSNQSDAGTAYRIAKWETWRQQMQSTLKSAFNEGRKHQAEEDAKIADEYERMSLHPSYAETCAAIATEIRKEAANAIGNG